MVVTLETGSNSRIGSERFLVVVDENISIKKNDVLLILGKTLDGNRFQVEH